MIAMKFGGRWRPFVQNRYVFVCLFALCERDLSRLSFAGSVSFYLRRRWRRSYFLHNFLYRLETKTYSVYLCCLFHSQAIGCDSFNEHCELFDRLLRPTPIMHIFITADAAEAGCCSHSVFVTAPLSGCMPHSLYVSYCSLHCTVSICQNGCAASVLLSCVGSARTLCRYLFTRQ